LRVNRRKCCQLSSSDDHHQFITLSVHLSVKHDGREAGVARVCLRQLRLAVAVDSWMRMTTTKIHTDHTVRTAPTKAGVWCR